MPNELPAANIGQFQVMKGFREGQGFRRHHHIRRQIREITERKRHSINPPARTGNGADIHLRKLRGGMAGRHGETKQDGNNNLPSELLYAMIVEDFHDPWIKVPLSVAFTIRHYLMTERIWPRSLFTLTI